MQRELATLGVVPEQRASFARRVAVSPQHLVVRFREQPECIFEHVGLLGRMLINEISRKRLGDRIMFCQGMIGLFEEL